MALSRGKDCVLCAGKVSDYNYLKTNMRPFMKRLFGIMNIILCLELIIGPHTPGIKKFYQAHADDTTCPAGLTFDSTLNRCITSDQQATIMNATKSCNGDKECYK